MISNLDYAHATVFIAQGLTIDIITGDIPEKVSSQLRICEDLYEFHSIKSHSVLN